MTDVHSPERRSNNMRAIRSKNTAPEIQIRKLLFTLGFRYRLHVRGMPGKPDLVLAKHRIVVFVHGCFWHGHGCYLFRLPQTRPEFWKTKIEQNRLRDVRDVDALVKAGWRVITVWECAVKGRLRWTDKNLGRFLQSVIPVNENSEPVVEIRHVTGDAEPDSDMSSAENR